MSTSSNLMHRPNKLQHLTTDFNICTIENNEINNIFYSYKNLTIHRYINKKKNTTQRNPKSKRESKLPSTIEALKDVVIVERQDY